MAAESSEDMHMQYRWIHGAPRRSLRIPKAHWDKHKAELRDLYHDMSLDDLMKLMKERHGFAPTRRQYTYQFEKWGFVKYRKDTTHSSSAERLLQDSALEPLCSTAQEPPAILETSEHGKRHRSMQSIQSSASGSSSPLRPPAKRGRHDSQNGSNIGTSSHAELPQDSGVGEKCSPSSHADSKQINRMEASHPSPPPRPYRGNLFGRPSFFCESDPVPPLTFSEHCKNEIQRPEFPSQWESVEDISTAFRAITSQRPISTYTAEDMGHIQLAAEYLEAMGYEEDAFSLYSLVLKKLHEDFPQDKVTFLHAILNYSRCVSTPGHCEIIQHHLQAQAQQISEENSSYLLYQFLIEMALAETCSRKYDTPAVKTHLRKARQLLIHNDDFNHCLNQVFNQLPRNDGSLDLILYQSLRRVGDPYTENLLPRENPEEFTSWPIDIFALQKTLYRIPGPFELKHREMGNPCIRLCLQWCYQKLLQLKSVSGPWDEDASSDKKVHEQKSTTVHRMRLFTCLWRISLNETGASSPVSGADTWMSRTHSRLGVNATELLMITCAQIVHESSTSKSSEVVHTQAELMQRWRQGAESLLGQCDKLLAWRFLNAFVQYRTLEEEESQWLKDLRQESRAEITGKLEHSLNTTFSQTRDFTTQLRQSTRRLSTQMAEVAKHMTMTSSLRSSDSSLLNFRKVKESMDRKVKKLKEQPSMSSASFGDSSRRSRLSFWTVSQLSQAMERTSISLKSTGPVT